MATKKDSVSDSLDLEGFYGSHAPVAETESLPSTNPDDTGTRTLEGSENAIAGSPELTVDQLVELLLPHLTQALPASSAQKPESAREESASKNPSGVSTSMRRVVGTVALSLILCAIYLALSGHDSSSQAMAFTGSPSAAPVEIDTRAAVKSALGEALHWQKTNSADLRGFAPHGYGAGSVRKAVGRAEIIVAAGQGRTCYYAVVLKDAHSFQPQHDTGGTSCTPQAIAAAQASLDSSP